MTARAIPRTGRPLRALWIVLGGWTAARAGVVLGSQEDASVLRLLEPRHHHHDPIFTLVLDDDALGKEALAPVKAGPPGAARGHLATPSPIAHARFRLASVPEPGLATPRLLPAPWTLTPGLSRPIPHLSPAPETPPTGRTDTHIRLSGSAWVLARDRSAGVGSPQLSGAQAGVRIYIGRPAGLALTARLAAPLNELRGKEAAVGVAFRTPHIGAIIEQRVALDSGARSAPIALVYGGIDEVNLALGISARTYGQAGVVGVNHPEGFADGVIHLDHDIISGKHVRLRGGMGAWGSVQRNATRLDIGPQVEARTQIGAATVALSVDYRARIAGNAEPGSGPAITFAASF